MAKPAYGLLRALAGVNVSHLLEYPCLERPAVTNGRDSVDFKASIRRLWRAAYARRIITLIDVNRLEQLYPRLYINVSDVHGERRLCKNGAIADKDVIRLEHRTEGMNALCSPKEKYPSYKMQGMQHLATESTEALDEKGLAKESMRMNSKIY